MFIVFAVGVFLPLVRGACMCFLLLLLLLFWERGGVFLVLVSAGGRGFCLSAGASGCLAKPPPPALPAPSAKHSYRLPPRGRLFRLGLGGGALTALRTWCSLVACKELGKQPLCMAAICRAIIGTSKGNKKVVQILKHVMLRSNPGCRG